MYGFIYITTNLINGKRYIGQKKYDVIVANIVADVIIGMAQILFGFCKPGGILIVSGILMERAGEVKDALEKAGFSLQEKREQSDWCALELVCNT